MRRALPRFMRLYGRLNLGCFLYFNEHRLAIPIEQVNAAVKTLDDDLGPGRRQRGLFGDLEQTAIEAHGEIIAYGAPVLKAKDGGKIGAFIERSVPIGGVSRVF